MTGRTLDIAEFLEEKNLLSFRAELPILGR
jgi:hypothetical protein